MSYLSRPTNPSQWRWPVALLLLTNAAIHVYLAPEHLAEIPYIGALFIALSVASILLAVALILLGNAWVWTATGALNLLALVAFVVSRTVGLPQHDHDIGNWTEPLGYLTMAVEILTIIVASVAIFVIAPSRRGATEPY